MVSISASFLEESLNFSSKCLFHLCVCGGGCAIIYGYLISKTHFCFQNVTSQRILFHEYISDVSNNICDCLKFFFTL